MTRKHLHRVLNTGVVIVFLFSCLRLALIGLSLNESSGGNPLELMIAVAIGLVNDAAVASIISLPLLLFRRESHFKVALAGTLFIAGLSVISEIIFWSEFHSRFNFIAVDYLVYTQEVFRNIWESYPVLSVLLSLAGVSGAAALMLARRHPEFVGFAPIAALLIVVTGFLSINHPYDFSDVRAREISKNGLAALIEAYYANQIDYQSTYKTQKDSVALAKTREMLAEDAAEMNPGPDDIGRLVTNAGPRRRLNVILVTMESMSARYLGVFGNKQSLTPNLDRLANEGLLFSNVFATGTRTVRGLEALLLSVPPTPGQAIVRRPRNQNLFNLGDYFEDAGYRAEFLYGGRAYFDNMKEFFSANAMTVIDQTDIPEDRISFANAWGVCDEDLFSIAISRADESIANGKPFFQMIMTTSNHRPYTYPQKIDIQSGTGRSGAVKYADHAIGEFLRQAEKKTWFKDTVFVFVADHDAAVAGNLDVPVGDFRIPLIFYAPGLVKPARVDRLGSQIDVAPTILGLLGASYKSHFFGHDLMGPGQDRAFLGTYQKIGYLKNSVLTLLGPNRAVEQFSVGANDKMERLTTMDNVLVDEAVAYYQTASLLFTSGKMRDDGDDQLL